jgi:NAD(P)-dependent dehydrogenase (short-subunit alcohol dehydrogenase family)
MIALTKHQATTLAPVRSNAIILGGIYRDHSDVFRERYEAKVPLCRMATEQDAVELCLFLASDKAAYITGACIPRDGGLSAMA